MSCQPPAAPSRRRRTRRWRAAALAGAPGLATALALGAQPVPVSAAEEPPAEPAEVVEEPPAEPAEVVEEPPAEPAEPEDDVYHAVSRDGSSFSKPKNLSGDPGPDGAVKVVADDGEVYLVWKRGDPGEVVYRRVSGGHPGRKRVIEVSETPEDSAEPDLVVVGDEVHVVWSEARLGPDGALDPCCDADEVYHRSSRGRGPFSARANLSQSPGFHTRDPDLVAGGRLLGVVYEERVSEEPAENDEIMFQRSTDGAGTWSPAVNVSNDPDNSEEPAVSISGDDVHVVFEDRSLELDDHDDRLAYARSTDAGATFLPPALLPFPVAGVGLATPAVAAAGDVVNVVGCGRAVDEAGTGALLYLWRSDTAGAAWGDPVNLSDGSGQCHRPAISADGDRVVLAWEDEAPEGSRILSLSSRDGGRSFGSVRSVSETGQFKDANLSVDPRTGDVHVVWAGRPSGPPAPDDPLEPVELDEPEVTP